MSLATGHRTALAAVVGMLLVSGCADGGAAAGSPLAGAAPGSPLVAAEASGRDAASVGGGAQPTATGGSVAVDPGVTVTGVGRVEGRPDTLRASIGVEVQRDTVQEALEAANAASDAVLSALDGEGVGEDDVQTTEFSVYPRYNDGAVGTPQVIGYSVSNLLDVRVRELDRAGEVLQAAVEVAGDAARVHSLSFALEDNDALLTAAREAAFADARRKAEQYAQLSGRQLGALVGVSEVVSDAPRPEQMDMGMEGGAAADRASVPLQPGQQEVGVTVTAVWALQ